MYCFQGITCKPQALEGQSTALMMQFLPSFFLRNKKFPLGVRVQEMKVWIAL